MPKLLAIDTSSSITWIALCLEGEIKEYRTGEPRQAAQQLLPLIQAAFSEASIGAIDLDGIVVVTGPGSFTGLRIGIGVAQGISVANSTSLIGVSSLALMAQTGVTPTESADFLVCIPARDDEVYFGAYKYDGSTLVLLDRERVVELKAGSPQLSLPERKWTGIGEAWQNQSQLEELFGVSVSNRNITAKTSMNDLCVIGLDKLSRGETLLSEQLLPNYVKEQLDYG